MSIFVDGKAEPAANLITGLCKSVVEWPLRAKARIFVVGVADIRWIRIKMASKEFIVPLQAASGGSAWCFRTSQKCKP